MTRSGVVLLLGPPGSGKGTQRARLEERLGATGINTGELLRAAVDAGSSLGIRAAGAMRSGDLVDDETMVGLVRERLAALPPLQPVVLEGFPRTVRQASGLDACLRASDRELAAVVLLDVPEDVLLSRLQDRGRDDDGRDVVRRRLHVYREASSAVEDLYRSRGLLHRVDGHQEPSGVTGAVVEAITG